MPRSKRAQERPLPRQASLVEQLGSAYDILLTDLFKEPIQKLGSMNMEHLLQSLTQSDEIRSRLGAPSEAFPSPSGSTRRTTRHMYRQDSLANVMRQDSLSLPHDTGTKTVEEVWRLIQGQDHVEGTSLASLRVGELLDMAGAQLGPSHVTSASKSVRLETFQSRRIEGLHPNLPPFNNMSSFLLHGTGAPTAGVAIPDGDPPRPDKNAAAAARAARQKKRKERSALSNEVNEEDQKAKQRLVKNRESAARSRQRFKKYTEELEAEVHRLKLELAVLRQSIQEKGEGEKDSWILASRRLPLRRTRTLKY